MEYTEINGTKKLVGQERVRDSELQTAVPAGPGAQQTDDNGAQHGHCRVDRQHLIKPSVIASSIQLYLRGGPIRPTVKSKFPRSDAPCVPRVVWRPWTTWTWTGVNLQGGR
eukprot:1192306-Prorocentrum_minimum.AAC.1